ARSAAAPHSLPTRRSSELLIGRITGALGGMAAESIVFDVVTSGAESDLETATSIARQMVGRWGMSEKIGPVTVLPQEGDPRMAGDRKSTRLNSSHVSISYA